MSKLVRNMSATLCDRCGNFIRKMAPIRRESTGTIICSECARSADYDQGD